MGSMLRHITLLVINSLRADTHTHAYRRSQTEEILRNQACTGLQNLLRCLTVTTFKQQHLNNTIMQSLYKYK